MSDKQMRLLCRFNIWHVWSIWEEPEAFGYWLKQRRHCLECGRISRRSAGYAIQGRDYELVD